MNSIITALISSLFIANATAKDTKKTNSVIIFCDDMGYQDLQCFGAPKIKTPNIDKMAAEGMKFTSFYGQTVCGPARAAIMTSSYPVKVAKVVNPIQKIDIHPIVHTDEAMIPEILKEQGYATAAFGKWDLAGHSQTKYNPGYMPRKQGFDYFFGTPSSNDRNVHLLRNEEVVKKNAPMGSLTETYTDEVIQFIDKNHKQPFFVYLAHSMPHTVLGVSEPFKGKSTQGIYGDVIEEIDFNTGRILNHLKKIGVDDNTYVIFTSDNGPWWIKKDHGGSALPRRRAKTTTWEGGVRVPTIIRAPGRVKAGTVSDLTTTHMDLLPTLTHLSGGKMPTDRVIDGRDISKVLHEGSDPSLLERPLFHYQHTHLQAVRQGKWKLIMPRPADSAVVPSSWKRMVKPSDTLEIKTPILIDLNADISETTDVARKKPNIIIFLTDDQGYSDVGCYGSPDIETPHFDRMAKEGMLFTDAYVGSPVCGPSRSALMTGSYPIRIGEPRNTKALHTVPHTKELMIPEVLKSHGYATALIGKWHAGEAKTQGDPNSQGFDYFFGTPKFNGFTKLIEQTKMRAPLVRNREVVVKGMEQKEMDQLTTMYTEESVKFITENKDKPFFLYLAHNMPHVPLGVSDKFKGKSKGGFYGDVIMELDWSMGVILKTLKDLKIDDNTLIVFVSDNGPWIEKQIGDHAGHADPLKGAKMMSWEGGARVPCIMRWAGKIPAGKTSDAIITTMDLMPTLAGLAGASLPDDLVLDGKNIYPLITGATDQSPHKYYYYYCFTHLQAIRDERWKMVLLREAKPRWMGWWGRMIEEVKEVQLYDLSKDLGEKTNVAEANPEVVTRLMKQVESARVELGDYNVLGTGARFFDAGKKRPKLVKTKAAK